jgi:phosphotransferase system HPr (HPr) family protein
VKLVLADALHARPASVLVRVSAQFDASIVVRKGDRSANAKSILDVLRLQAAAGDEIELEVSGAEAIQAQDTLRALVERRFDPDLAPELGESAAPGIALGRALLVTSADAEVGGERGTTAAIEATRLRDAFAVATRELEELVKSLPTAEAGLFAPEVDLLADLLPRALASVADGTAAERAVAEVTRVAPSDLVIDVRERLLDILRGGGSNLARALATQPDADVILVVESLAPSLVAALPDRVRGIVSSGATHRGQASHAAILARGRGIPLLYVEEHVSATIEEGTVVLIDTIDSPALLWVGPSESLVAERTARGDARAKAPQPNAVSETARLPAAVRVNVASLRDDLGAAEGIGLVRTELMFATRTEAPTAREQAAAYVALVARAQGAPVVIRLFDAGGDKPLRWLPGRTDGARGMELLFEHPEALQAQLDAIARARQHGDARVLLPLARSSADVDAIRARAAAGLPIGAMIETIEAARTTEQIADHADFVCIGTNDLAASVLGVDRARASSLSPAVLAVVRDIVEAAHAKGRTVTVCGELAADDRGGRILVALGVDALSVAPTRLEAVRRVLLASTAEERRTLADEALRA